MHRYGERRQRGNGAESRGRMFELDFLEKAKGLATLKEDREFLKTIESGIVHRKDSHYEMPLPVKEENVTLPNNRSQAEQILKCLKKRLLSDERYRQDYVSFMNNIVNKGYATQVSDRNATASEGHVWTYRITEYIIDRKLTVFELSLTAQLVIKESLLMIIYCKART